MVTYISQRSPGTTWIPWGKQRRIIILFGAALAVLCLLPAAVAAQAVVVTGTNNLSFGTLFRSNSRTVDEGSSSAARFTVTGRKNRKVRLTVTRTNMTRGSASLTLGITNADCAFSFDGTSWTNFSTGTLYHDTRFPNVGGTPTIYVRVGGSTSTTSKQQRGTYTGSVTLAAVYN